MRVACPCRACHLDLMVRRLPQRTSSVLPTLSNEVCYKSYCLHKSFHSALQRDHCVCFDSHSGSPADPALCNVKCPGNSSQFCGGDSWYTFHLMYLWVAPVETICSGMPELVGNNMPMSTTVCLDCFNEIVPCISTWPSDSILEP